jgi:uncharacterized protein (DUF849 family)
MLLKAAVNGARAREAHPMLPTTPIELAWAAAAAVQAGAGAVHVHVRGAGGAESLEREDVTRTLEAVRRAIPSIGVGISTGLWITKDPQRRHSLVSQWTTLPDFASVNFHEEGAVAVAELLVARGVGVEAGLFTAASAETFGSAAIAPRCLRVLIEPRGSDVAAALDTVRAIEAVLDARKIGLPRLLHGSGATAWALVQEAVKRGYDTRAGLEDMLDLPDGRQAPGNAAIIAEARRLIGVRSGR